MTRLIDADKLHYHMCPHNDCDQGYTEQCQTCPQARIRKEEIDEAETVKISLVSIAAKDVDEAYMRGREVGLAEGILRGMGRQNGSGKWIATGQTNEHYGPEYRCSECGETMVCIYRMKFCPYCGAVLEGGT